MWFHFLSQQKSEKENKIEQKKKTFLPFAITDALTAENNWVIVLSVKRSHTELQHLFHFTLCLELIEYAIWGRFWFQSTLRNVAIKINISEKDVHDEWDFVPLMTTSTVLNISHCQGQSSYHKINLHQAFHCFLQTVD